MNQNSKRIITKTREDYNRIAHHFSGTRRDLWPELKKFEKYVEHGQNILDWGCGNGRLVLMLKDKGINYVGLDQSDELIKIAKEKYADEIKTGWVEFHCTAEEDKKFPSEYFDVVFMIASFHHLPDYESRLALLKKVYVELKVGGRLIMTNWNLESDWAKEKIIKKGWKVIGENDYLIPWTNLNGEVEVERYYHHFAKEELGKLLKEAGYTVESNEYTDEVRDRVDKGGRNLITISIKKVPN